VRAQLRGRPCGRVDGPAAARFLLACVRQRLAAPAARAKLEAKLRALAEQERAASPPDPSAKLRSELAAVRSKRERAGRNLALADGPEQYQTVAAVFQDLRQQERALEDKVAILDRRAAKPDVDAEVTAALAGLERLGELASSPGGMAGASELFRRVNARLFLQFTEGHLGKRAVRQLASGVVTFGDAPPPVPLYEGPTDRRHVKKPMLANLTGEPSPPVA
jgi:hypothetical protein